MTIRSLIRRGRAACIALAAAVAVAAGSAASFAADSAVIVMYHRFGEDKYPSTSVTLAQFEAQIERLASGGYTVLPVPEILAALDAGRPLPERTIGITVDDATRSTFVEGWPRLEEAGFPLTVFVSTDAVDQGHAGIMSWDELRQLVAAGVTIGNHSAAHGHMWQAGPEANRADLLRAQRRLQEELGVDAALFAYPYGEWNGAVRALVEELGFTAAFGQHSGVVAAHTDRFNLPRFALNESYGAIDRFGLVVDTVPLGARAITPADRILTENPPALGFTVEPPLANPASLACYASGGVTATLEHREGGRVEVEFDGPFPAGRARLNCTAPAEGGRWHWFGLQFVVP
ncbi:MAG: polysaccharide deacetylase family protein [Rhodospirillales bacterium]|nr:polysaccharide deacetylase family protein [Rhodospirillales bacterium]